MSSDKILHDILSEGRIKALLQEAFQKTQPEKVGEKYLVKPTIEVVVKESLFEDLVISRLPRPQVTTARDLVDAFIQNVRLQPHASFDEIYTRFLLVAVADVFSERCSPPFVFFTYKSSERFDLRELKNPVLWQSEEDFVLSHNGILLEYRPFDPDSELDENQPHVAYATLVGHCTSRALDSAVAEISGVLSSLFRSFQLLAEMQEREEINRFIERASRYSKDTISQKPPEEVLAMSPEELAPRSGQENPGPNLDRVQASAQELPIPQEVITFEEPWGGLSFIPRLGALLDAYFGLPSKKESVARRIRNGVHLLSNADDQRKSAVGLALSVTAMESLLCDHRESIGKMLAENVANFLEPDPKQRFNAIDYVKSLYDARSRVLHGSEVEASEEQRDNARKLAAAVLIAFVDRREFVSRLTPHHDEKPKDLFEKLEKHRYTEGPFQGVIASPITVLWRPHEPKEHRNQRRS